MRSIFALLTVLLATGCASTRVEWQIDPSRVGRPPATWAFEDPPSPQQVGPASPSTAEGRRILAALAGQLEARGYRRVAAEEAEVLVRYYAAIEQQIDLRAPEYQYWRRFEEGVALGPGIVAEGTLVLEIVDPRAERVLYQGIASRTTERVEDVMQHLDEIAERLVSRFDERVRG